MNDWYDSFVESLQKKYPKKVQLTQALMDLLAIERESVYRRLRGDIIFPAHEIMKIAAAWHISLDEIVKVNSSTALFKLHLGDYLNPTQELLKLMHFWLEEDVYAHNIENLHYVEISNQLPRIITAGFPHLHRFRLLKQTYQYSSETALPFSKIFYPEKVAQMSDKYYQSSKKYKSVNLIFDHSISYSLVSDIQYFQSIYLITEEEKELIKKDIYAVLDYLSEVASKGCWLETGKKMNLYISRTSIDTNYSYFHSDSLKLCCIRAFGRNELYSENSIMIEKCWEYVQAQEKAAVLISKADERSRVEFFRKQRNLIDTL